MDVYAAAFGEPPYNEGADQVAGFREKIGRYSAQRDGFRFVAVHGEGGRLDAIGLAVLARPGDWWRDRVASALSSADTDRWLGALCLEVVHIAVRPAVQRERLGTVTHDLLLAGSPAPTAVLSCHPHHQPPQRLYTGRGWQRIGTFPIEEGERPLVLSRDL